MDTFLEIVQAVQGDLNIGDESPLMPLSRVQSAVISAHRKCASLFMWPETEDAQKTSTENGADYYDFPDDWVSDSMWRLEIDGDTYGEEPDGSPMRFQDYLLWKEKYPDSTKKKWSVQKRRFFVSPTPTTNGINNIVVWGHFVPADLVEDADVTIFSYNRQECNIAIELEAVAILKNQGENEKTGQFYSADAKGILATAWSKIRKNQAKYDKNQPFLDVPDFFKGESQQPIDPDDIGNF